MHAKNSHCTLLPHSLHVRKILQDLIKMWKDCAKYMHRICSRLHLHIPSMCKECPKSVGRVCEKCTDSWHWQNVKSVMRVCKDVTKIRDECAKNMNRIFETGGSSCTFLSWAMNVQGMPQRMSKRMSEKRVCKEVTILWKHRAKNMKGSLDFHCMCKECEECAKSVQIIWHECAYNARNL